MPDSQASPYRTTTKFRLWLFFTMVPAVFFTDFLTKLIVRRTMTAYGETVPIVDGLIKLRFIYNEGIAFGLKLGLPTKWILTVVSLAVAIFLVCYIFFSGYDDRPGLVSLNLIVGGALGNLHDRITYGRVVDFIECGIGELTWPVFNVADIAVTCGAIILAVRLLFYGEKAERKTQSGRDHPPGGKGPTDP